MTDYLVRDGVFDVDNDGMADRVVSGKRIGTRHGDMFTLTDPLGRAHEYAVDQDDPWRWTLGAGWLPFRGFFYAVHFHGEDGSFPSHMTLHTPMGSEVICAFRSSVTEHASALSPADQPLCRRVVDQGIDDAAIGPSTPRSSDRRETDTNLPRRRETHAQAEYVVDFDNDGVDERLVLLAFATGAGRGFDNRYFDITESSDRAAGGDGGRALLMRLQGVDLTDTYPIRDRPSNMPRWVRIDGKMYLENRHVGPSESRAALFHDLRTVQDGAIRDVCNVTFEVATSIRKLFPAR